MKIYLVTLWEKSRNAFWVIPSIVIFCIMSVLYVTTHLSISHVPSLIRDFLFFKANPEGARTILGSLATAIMTVVGVVFSITIVVLQQVSSQYTPRAVQNFVRSVISQVVLGFFLGTFIYCLLLLTVVQPVISGNKSVAVPQLALSVAIALSLICLSLLIAYIQYITKAIQSTQIIANISLETHKALSNVSINRSPADAEGFHAYGLVQTVPIYISDTGYFQDFKWQKLEGSLRQNQWLLEVKVDLGTYVQKNELVAEYTSSEKLSKKDLETIQRSFVLGQERTSAQDPLFGISKMVDVGVRALSPGINDPSTALEAIHGITSVALHFSNAYPLENHLKFAKGRQIKIPKTEAENFIGVCYDQLLQFGKEHQPILKLIRADLSLILEGTQDPEIIAAVNKRLSLLRTYFLSENFTHFQSPEVLS